MYTSSLGSHNQAAKLFSSQLNDLSDSDSLINKLLIHLLNKNHSLSTFHEVKKTDTENFKNEVTTVFTPTETNNSSETEISAIPDLLSPSFVL